MVNLLIELYDYPYIENFYYIQNNEIKEFSDEIVKKLREISIDALIHYSFVDERDCAEEKEEKDKTISEIMDCLTGYSIEKIFIMSDASPENSFMVKINNKGEINMESKVEMDLSEYTALIRENEKLRTLLHNCKEQLEDSIERYVYTYKFEKMTKEECVKELSFATEELVGEYTTSWNTVDYLHDKFPCFSKEEIEKAIIDYVKSKIKERMDELKDKE